MKTFIYFSFSILLFLSGQTTAQGVYSDDSISFSGTVVNSSALPIANAIIRRAHDGFLVKTDEYGVFSINLLPSGEMIEVSKDGFSSFRSNITNYAKGVVIMDTDESTWMTYNDFRNQTNALSKALYKEGIQYIKKDSLNSSNETKAFPFLWRAAFLGHIDARYQIGRMYEDGKVVAQDYVTAANWYKKALSSNSANERLGVMHEEGLGVEQDYDIAASYYQKGNTELSLTRLKRLVDEELVKQPELFRQPEFEKYEIPDFNAQFPGGDDSIYEWLARHIVYPHQALQRGIGGRVFVQFVINIDGTITDTRILRSPDPSLSEETLRVLESMPKWKPAIKDGKPIKSRFNLPIMFRTK